MLLFLKALIRGGAASDLFATPVDVKGYTTKDGTYVVPHRAIRHKGQEAPPKAAPPPAADLFAHAAARPPAPPKPAERAPSVESTAAAADPAALLLADDATWETAIYAAACRRWDAGHDVTYSTSGQHTVLRPAARDRMRLVNGRIEYQEGSKWIVLGPSGQAIDSLAGRLGLPTSWDRTKARADSPEHQAAHAKRVADATPEILALQAAREKTRLAVLADPDSHELEAADKAAYAAISAAAKRHGLSRFDADDIAENADAAEPEAAVAGTDRPAVWGVDPGTKPVARRKLNKAALDLLEAKSDEEMTADDKAVLARYTGNGGCGDSLNEFYTPPDVAAAMWQMLQSAGFGGGTVLEPSCGTGVFMHTAPANAVVTGVEMDPVSARIARILHGGVHTSCLEAFAVQDGALFDAVIGNAPFGVRGNTVNQDWQKRKLQDAEQYFLDTGLDKLRDGGLMAMIVPTSVMNGKNNRAFRERLLRKAEFLGAHRLPNTAFDAANTDVTTDILLFRKRPADVAGALSTLTQDQLKSLGVWDADYLAGYFSKRGAAYVYGTEGTAQRAYGEIYAVHGAMDGVADVIAAWQPPAPAPGPDMAQIMAALGDDEKARVRAANAAVNRPYQVAKKGDIRTIDGTRYILDGEPPRWHRLEASTPQAVTDALKISEGLADLIDGRAKDPRLVRAEVSEGLDEYISQHGLPSGNRDLLAWISAPSLDKLDGEQPDDHAARVRDSKRRVARLLGAVNKDGTYSDVISGRQGEQAEATVDSVAARLATDEGGFTVDQLAVAAHRPVAEVLDHLHASPGYAVDPDGRTWTTMDAYLSGDLWAKLDAARAAAAHEGLDAAYAAKYRAQAEALETTIAPASLEDVEILITSGFITPADITAYFDSVNEEWQKENPGKDYGPGRVVVTYEDGFYTVKGKRWGGADLLYKYLNRTGVRKDDRDNLDRMNAAFADWVRTGPNREAIEDRYNRTYKGYREREYSEAPLVIPGLTMPWELNGYHFSGLRWALETGKGIIADDVGLGKTGRGLMLAKLAKVHGTAKKPTFVVPKSVLANWVDETQTWFRGSRVMVVGESYQQNEDGSFKRDADGKLIGRADTPEERREKYHQIQQNDYDFILISAPSWDELDLDPITKGQYANDDFWAKRGDKLDQAGDKRLRKLREAHDQALANREFQKREDTVYLNDLGIDLLLMDEGHAYKNLFSAGSRFGMQPKFLGGSGESNRAQDTFFKSKFIRSKNGGKGVFLLTATPTKNSPLEIYSMLSHVAPEAFDRMGIKNAEDFIDRFVEFKDDNVLTTSGAVETALVTEGFKNLGELREVMRRYINRRTADQVGLKLPEAEAVLHTVDMSPAQEALYVELREAAKQSGGGDAEGDAHIFSIMDKMQKASTDLRLVDGGYAGEASPKLDKLADTAVRHAEDGGQIIFCEHVDEHERIADALAARGVPRKEIGIVNAKTAKSSSARQAISDKFNKGTIKYVIGNKTMEQGMNLQQRTSDIHHMDIPWEPGTTHQRNGRGRRQGNKRANIRIHTYLAKRSFDGYRYQTITSKKNWQDLLWNGGDRVENLDRESLGSRADMLIMLAADPEAARAKYEADKAGAVHRQQVEARARAAESFRRLRSLQASVAKLKEEKRDNTKSAALLTVKMQRARELLANDAAFPHKDLLDSTEAAIFEPVTGIAWRKGMGLEVAPGKDAPIDVPGDKPERFVVDIVDEPNKLLWLRSLGDRRSFPVGLKAEQLQNGVSSYRHTPELEREARDEYLAIEGEARVKDAKTFDDVYKLPPETAAKHAPMLQARLKDAVRNYKISRPYGNVPLVGPDGTLKMAQSYEADKLLDTHDYLLPTHDHREKAINAYVEHRLSREIKTRYRENNRRRGSYGGHGDGEAIGVKGHYPNAPYDSQDRNPWDHAIGTVFGKDVQTEAKRRAQAKVVEGIDAASTLHAAFEAAHKAVKLPNIGHGGGWPEPVVRALHQKAAALKVLDAPLRDHATVGEVGRFGAMRSKAAGHADLYKVSHHNFLDERARGHDYSVGAFLKKISSGSLKDELADKAPEATAA